MSALEQLWWLLHPDIRLWVGGGEGGGGSLCSVTAQDHRIHLNFLLFCLIQYIMSIMES